ncbi:transporter substrate-binding domain-containing protein [Thalassotalea sp. G2M2-11]|uniref:transporter substrate-binding domain-containing protein n=1 Tax=Thalassotalea sp. G2M2-11 TaxID=2787627 RepID=UPI0019D27F17|nr:transporter substrate-binding domain-containing protein [Thalassotalea sp. G2M2-11]
MKALLQRAIVYPVLIMIVLFTSNQIAAQPVTADKKVYTIAVNQTSYPYHFANEKGEVEGIMVDLWRLWAKKQQVKIEFVVLNWQQTLDQVKDKRIDIHAGLAKTEERSQYFNFSEPFFHFNSYFRVHRDLPKFTKIQELLPYTIGVVAGSSHVEQLAQLTPQLKLRLYKSRFELFDAALAGEIVAFSNLDKLSKRYPRYKDLQTKFPVYKKVLFHRDNYVSAVAKDNFALIDFIDQGFAKISNEEKIAIEKKWLGVSKKNDSISLVFTPELPPFMDISSSGKPQGLFIDIWRLWAETMGLNIEFIPQSTNDALEVISQGGADIHIAFTKEGNANNKLMVANQVYSVASNVYVNKNLPNITHLSQLKGKKLGVFESAAYREQLEQEYPEISLVFFRDYATLMEAADYGKIDAMVGIVENMEAQLALAKLRKQFYSFTRSPFTIDIYSFTQKGNTRLAEIIQEGFNSLPVDELIKLEKRWLSDPSKGYYQVNATEVDLTEHENVFLQQHPEIKIGLVRNWKPMEFIDDNGQPSGVNIDINQLIEQRTGIKFSYVAFDNWTELFTALTVNDVDVIASATETEERKKSLNFSDVYWNTPWVIIHQRHERKLSNITDYYGKELAIVRGYYLINDIRKTHPQINLRLVDNYEEGLLAVKNGVVDGFIENMATASELINRESIVKLNISVIEEFEFDPNSYAIRQDWPLLKSIIDKALLSISESEKQAIYEKWFTIHLETGLDKSTVLKLSGQVAVIILVILIIIIVWNRRLYREINMRKSLEEKMKHMATHDELTGLANRTLMKDRINTAIHFHQRQSLLMAVLFIDLDGFKTINDSYGHDVGDELLVEVSKRLNGCVRKSDTIVRFGGDEFVLLLTGLHHKEEASFIADKVLKLIQQPFTLPEVVVNIGCSIGIAMYPDDGMTDTELLKVADTLMYKVKDAGKNHYVFN